jgi:MFS family permease
MDVMDEKPASRATSNSDAGWLQNFVFVLCGIGLNLCFSTYLAYIKVYGVVDDSMLGYMKISIFLAASFVVIVQGILDTYGPSLANPKTKYTVCISTSILAMTATLAAMPFNHSMTAILLFGTLIGLFDGSGMTYSMALASCYSGGATKYVNTGMVLALLIPVGLSLAIGFYEEETTPLTEVLFTAIPAVLCFISFVLFVGVVLTRGFDAAFERMARTEQHQGDLKDGEDAPLLEKGKVEVNKDDEENERWFGATLAICVPVMCLTHILTAGFVPLMQIVADLAYAHILMLVRFFAEFVGRLCSHVFGDYFGAKTMLFITILRVILVIVLVFQTFTLPDIKTSKASQRSYAVQVFFFYLMGNYVNSETMAIAINARRKDSRTVAYVMMLLQYASNVVALSVVVFLLQYCGVA